MPETTATRVVDGLGFGEGSISYATRESEVGFDILHSVESVINSPDILVLIDRDDNGSEIMDDGCGDGRGVGRIFRGIVEKAKSLNRAKVFGGGATMVAASLIGLGKVTGLTLRETFSQAVSLLHENELDFGAHTDNHRSEQNSGCGAIDKAQLAIQNSQKYEHAIRGAISALGVEDSGLDEVLGSFKEYAHKVEGENYSGAEVIDEILKSDKVVKELEGPHLEMYIILNMVKGYTVNQEKIREVSHGKVQVFGVDVWRMQELANKVHAEASDEEQHKAFLSELVYTLSVAGTLTKGDLPVYMIQATPQYATV